eukprot:2998318-Prymnesium_polylepis.3
MGAARGLCASDHTQSMTLGPLFAGASRDAQAPPRTSTSWNFLLLGTPAPKDRTVAFRSEFCPIRLGFVAALAGRRRSAEHRDARRLHRSDQHCPVLHEPEL